MIILLDIDGVLETTPSWKKVELATDGFMKLNKICVENLATFISLTSASVVLTTTHRINYTEAQWEEIFKARGLVFDSISKLNDKTAINQLLEKGIEIQEWAETFGTGKNYIIIDDDLSLNKMPSSIKERWIATQPHIGFDKEALDKAKLLFQTLESNLK